MDRLERHDGVDISGGEVVFSEEVEALELQLESARKVIEFYEQGLGQNREDGKTGWWISGEVVNDRGKLAREWLEENSK